ncbi:hypothetical protein Tco_1246622 [Tanacetum coccineum]
MVSDRRVPSHKFSYINVVFVLAAATIAVTVTVIAAAAATAAAVAASAVATAATAAVTTVYFRLATIDSLCAINKYF